MFLIFRLSVIMETTKIILISILTFVIFSQDVFAEENSSMDNKMKLMKIARECSVENQVSDLTARKIIFGELSSIKENDENAKVSENVNISSSHNLSIVSSFQCYIRCFLRKQDFLNFDDEPQIDVIVDNLAESVKISKNHLRKILKKCIDQSADEDSCDFSFKFLKCYLNDFAIQKYANAKAEL